MTILCQSIQAGNLCVARIASFIADAQTIKAFARIGIWMGSSFPIGSARTEKGGKNEQVCDIHREIRWRDRCKC